MLALFLYSARYIHLFWQLTNNTKKEVYLTSSQLPTINSLVN